ncbi:MAG: porphobilinogen deaminase [Myxococcales bacterium]
MIPVVRIGTRGSNLALVQSRHIAKLLVDTGIAGRVDLQIIKTSGDRIQDRSLSEIGGKGLFIKEIEEALALGEVDLAVHSMKDVPGVLPPGFVLTATLERESPFDVLITRDGRPLAEVPAGSLVGSSSLRRRSQILALRPDLRVEQLRGNVETRLGKVDRGDFDATILAHAGLRRLGLHDVKGAVLSADEMLPAIGQGALALETREDHAALREGLTRLDHPATAAAVTAERAVMRRLGGSCVTPVAGFAVVEGGALRLRALIAAPDGSRIVRGEDSGAPEDAAVIGLRLADRLLADGGLDILAAIGVTPEGTGA